MGWLSFKWSIISSSYERKTFFSRDTWIKKWWRFLLQKCSWLGIFAAYIRYLAAHISDDNGFAYLVWIFSLQYLDRLQKSSLSPSRSKDEKYTEKSLQRYRNGITFLFLLSDFNLFYTLFWGFGKSSLSPLWRLHD